MPLRSASTISPVSSIFSSFCAMVASFVGRKAGDGHGHAVPAPGKTVI